jgi:hypothetical protein
MAGQKLRLRCRQGGAAKSDECQNFLHGLASSSVKSATKTFEFRNETELQQKGNRNEKAAPVGELQRKLFLIFHTRNNGKLRI